MQPSSKALQTRAVEIMVDSFTFSQGSPERLPLLFYSVVTSFTVPAMVENTL